MVLSRIRFGNYFHERRCQDHADRKETSPCRGAGSCLLCPDAGRLVVIQMFLRSIHTSRLHRTDDLTSANVPDATSAIRLRAGRVFPAFAAILIPASVLSKKSARLSMSVRASSSPSI